ncbi:MAG: aminotransferase class I/II-fold pyridoxal phosphate-dependent enzyme [Clostridia bacterium]|nr:aminotransferase class I/II-fold pyridoxal phosphate-dependent enzyme [Clostridia bacterium]
MSSIQKMSKEELLARKAELESAYNEYHDRHLSFDMSRGKPGPDLLALTQGMLDCVNERDGYITPSGLDTRNYGVLGGIPEAKELFGEIFGIDPDNVIVCGNSSLNLMYDYISTAYAKGVCGEEPWARQGAVKFLCPVPGYDRHFAITEFFGIEMINVPLNDDGPDMDVVEEAIKDPLVKGIWCVPMYSNPTGITYSDETVKRFANLKPAAKDFRIMWDNAYCLHHLGAEQDTLLNIFEESKKANNENIVIAFTSTSKISFPGSGVAAIAASDDNIADIRRRLTVETIGYDKVNMLRHIRFFKDLDGIRHQMKLRGEVLSPKFHLVTSTLKEKLGGKDIAKWNEPKGGYFVSVNLLPGCASKVAEKLKDAGITITNAGATFPYGKDPKDANLRLAPSYPPLDELRVCMELFCICAELVSIEKLLSLK